MSFNKEFWVKIEMNEENFIRMPKTLNLFEWVLNEKGVWSQLGNWTKTQVMHLWGSTKRPMAWSWQTKKFKILNDLRWRAYDINVVNYDGDIQDGKMNDCCDPNTSFNKLEPTHQIVRYFNQYKHISFEKDASYVFLNVENSSSTS
jgi:hypothetical protein